LTDCNQPPAPFGAVNLASWSCVFPVNTYGTDLRL
jgi:hypothetical protein